MKIGLLDPALFSLLKPEEVPRRIELILQICRRHAVELAPIPEYWNALWSELARPLERKLSPEARRSLHELRKLGEKSKLKLPPLETPAGKVWRRGFEQLFGVEFFVKSWEEPMMRAVLQVLNAQHDAIVLTQNIPGRNLQQHAAGGSTLDEITRWVLYVQPKGTGHRQILCVHHPRNLQEKWTARFD